MPKVLMVAHDNAPSQGLGSLSDELEKRGHTISRHLSYGKTFEGNLHSLVEYSMTADAVITGFSHTEEFSSVETAVVRNAIEANVPVALYADNFGVYAYPWFSFVRENVNILFVQNEKDKRDASDMFPKANVVISGSPLWENKFFPPFTRKEVREKLGVADNEKLIMLPTSKTVIEIGMLLGMVIQATHVFHKMFKLFVTVHPGDKNDTVSYKNMEEYLPIRVLFKDECSSQEVLCGADLVITGGSATGIEAACMRIPTIDCLHEAFLARREAIAGTRSWEPGDLGVSRVVGPDIVALRSAIRELLTPPGFAQMLKTQEETFPQPTHKGAAAEKMANTLEKLLA